MSFDYDLVQGVSEEEFRNNVKTVDQLKSDPDFRLATEEEIGNVERLLDVQEGILSKVEFYVKKANCERCNSCLGIDDVVRTALIDAKHSKSAVLHTLIGNKYIVDRPKQIRCSSCNSLQIASSVYATIWYGCASGDKLSPTRMA